MGMTLNCIHIFIVTGNFLYRCVMRPAMQSAFLQTQSYLSTNLDHIFSNVSRHYSLFVLMYRTAVNQSTNVIFSQFKTQPHVWSLHVTRRRDHITPVLYASCTDVCLSDSASSSKSPVCPSVAGQVPEYLSSDCRFISGSFRSDCIGLKNLRRSTNAQSLWGLHQFLCVRFSALEHSTKGTSSSTCRIRTLQTSAGNFSVQRSRRLVTC